MGRMKDLIADEWDRAYREGFRDGIAAALTAVETLPGLLARRDEVIDVISSEKP